MNFFGKLAAGWKRTSFYATYNTKDERARGRLCMLLNGVASGVSSNLSGGLFYSGFLLEYGFDYSSISILLFVPYITSILYIFSPSILERFAKRKYILAAMKLLASTLSVLGITLLPMLFARNADGQVINLAAMKYAFIGLILISNAVNALFSSGYTAWHSNFLPENIRATYFFSSSCINSVVTYGVIFLLSLLTDKVKDTEYYLPVLTSMRYLAYILAIVDIIILLFPKEYEYPKTTSKPRLTDVFSLPFKNVPFLKTVIIIACVTFAMNVHTGYMDTYILDTVGVPYSLTNGINALYFLFFIIFGAMWNHFIMKHTWIKALGYVLLMDCPTYLLFAFITPQNYIWLYPVVRFSQHIFGVVRNTIVASLPYLNLPKEDTTNYLAFYTIINNVGAMLGRLVGLGVYEGFGEFEIRIFSASISSVPFLFGLVGILEILTGVLCFIWFRSATPKNLLDEYVANRAKRMERRRAKAEK